MKKVLTAAIISLLVGSSVMAADTYTGKFVEAQQKKIDAKAAPVINKEKALQQKQKDAAALQAKQEALRKQQIQEKQKAQQELVAKKKQQIQAQKESFKKQKQDLKDIYTIK